jgi:hypothetical protein
MKIYNGKWGKFLILTPVLFLILNAIYFMYASKEIRQTLLDEKYVEIVNAVDMLSAAVEANSERLWFDHEQNIKDSIEYYDILPQIFAAAYKVIDGELVIFTDRVYETSPLEPLERDEFIQAVFSNEQGSIVIGDKPKNQEYREVYLYYRWMPIYSAPDERYLIVMGVSYYSVSSTVPMWVSVGQWASMGVTFAINIWLILLLVRLGHIYESRQGDKWRKGKYYV